MEASSRPRRQIERCLAHINPRTRGFDAGTIAWFEDEGRVDTIFGAGAAENNDQQIAAAEGTQPQR